MARTTLALDDDLLRQLKQTAAAAGTTLQALANDLLRQALAMTPPARKYRLELPALKGRLLVDVADRRTMFDALDDRG